MTKNKRKPPVKIKVKKIVLIGLPLLIVALVTAWQVYAKLFSLESKVDVAQLETMEIISPYGVLADNNSGKIIWEKNSAVKAYPASLTKMMTAIIVLENTKDLSAAVTLTNKIFAAVYASHASVAGFTAGETATVTDLLYGLMLCSGGEAALGLASYVAGSEENFVALMNEKVQKLDLTNTHFTNVTGLQNGDHYSTAADMEAILAYGLENDTFRQIFTADSYTAVTDKHPDGLQMESTLYAEYDDLSYAGGKILGGKTGYTSAAGLCLASLANVNGRELIFVTIGADGNHASEAYHLEDALHMYSSLVPEKVKKEVAPAESQNQ